MKRIFSIILVAMAAVPAWAESLDRIVAVVDKEIILESELESQLQMLAMQNRLDLSKQAFKDSLANLLLDRMIEDKVYFVRMIAGGRSDAVLLQRVQHVASGCDLQE